MRRFAFFVVAMLSMSTLAGCTVKKEAKQETTVASTPTPNASAPAISGLNPATSQSVSDGVCATLIPDDWASSGNGRGFTASGARFILFGNYLAGDNEWTGAVNIIATVAAAVHAESHASADSISYAASDGTSYEIRRRIGDRYCDFSVTSSSPASAYERAAWLAVGASMTAASEATATS
jgi:hypothetical protein